MRIDRRRAITVIAGTPVLAATTAGVVEEKLVEFLFVQSAAGVVLANGD